MCRSVPTAHLPACPLRRGSFGRVFKGEWWPCACTVLTCACRLRSSQASQERLHSHPACCSHASQAAGRPPRLQSVERPAAGVLQSHPECLPFSCYTGRWQGAVVAVKVIEYEVHAGSTCDLSREPLLRWEAGCMGGAPQGRGGCAWGGGGRTAGVGGSGEVEMAACRSSRCPAGQGFQLCGGFARRVPGSRCGIAMHAALGVGAARAFLDLLSLAHSQLPAA